MGIKDNFRNPKGLVGRMMLSGMNMGHTPMAKWGFSKMKLPKKAEALDIGCGGGANIQRLLKQIPQGHVYGLDISEESVKKSKAKNKKHLGSRCEVYQGSAEQLPFKDESLDLVTAFETVYFWKNIPTCFAEVRRVLREGGAFYVINDPGDPNKHWEDMIPGMTSYKAEEIEAFMKNAGFQNIKIYKEKNMFCVKGEA